jgi:hypothetical protein
MNVGDDVDSLHGFVQKKLALLYGINDIRNDCKLFEFRLTNTHTHTRKPWNDDEVEGRRNGASQLHTM